jgi:flagellar biogenesis protein FliO
MVTSLLKRRIAVCAMLVVGAISFTMTRAAHAQTGAGTGVPAASASSGPGTRLSPALPLKRDQEPDDPARTVLVAAGLVLVVAIGAGYIGLRRSGRLPAGVSAAWGGRATQPTLRAAGRLLLSQQASVHTIQWGDEELLLGSTPHQVTLLAKRTVPGRGQEHSHKEDAA